MNDVATFYRLWRQRYGDRYVGHQHYWQRSMSRRGALRYGAAAGAGVLASAILPAGASWAAGTPAMARPIPGVFPGTPLHVQLPGPGVELSTITDFDGVLGVADLDGVGRGTDGPGLTFNVDMRFMQGRFVATDGQVHQGTFGFI